MFTFFNKCIWLLCSCRVYGSGDFFIMTESTINEPGCEDKRVDVPVGHSEIDRWLSIATTAKNY